MNEDEPTEAAWVQDLLTSLPQPRIPQEVAARLDAAIAATPLLPEQRGPADIPVPARRRGRSFLAGAGLFAGAALSVILLDPMGVAAAPPIQPASIAADAGSARVTEILSSSATRYTQSRWAEQAVAVASAKPSGPGSGTPPMWAEVETMPAADAEGAAACVAGLANQQGTLILVDRATYEGHPALVVVRRDGGMLEIHVLHARCTGAESAVLAHARVGAPSSGE